MLALCALSFGAEAQDVSKTEAATSVAKAYAATLEFSEEQIDMAKRIFGEHLLASRNNWAHSDGDKEVFQESQNSTFKATDEKIKAILNDDQLEIYQEKRKELKKDALDHYLKAYLDH